MEMGRTPFIGNKIIPKQRVTITRGFKFCALFLLSFMPLSSSALPVECGFYLSSFRSGLTAQITLEDLTSLVHPDQVLVLNGSRLYLVARYNKVTRNLKLLNPQQHFSFNRPLTSIEKVLSISSHGAMLAVVGASMAMAVSVDGLPLWFRSVFICGSAACSWVLQGELGSSIHASVRPVGEFPLTDQMRTAIQNIHENILGTWERDRGVLRGAIVMEQEFIPSLRRELINHGWTPWLDQTGDEFESNFEGGSPSSTQFREIDTRTQR